MTGVKTQQKMRQLIYWAAKIWLNVDNRVIFLISKTKFIQKFVVHQTTWGDLIAVELQVTGSPKCSVETGTCNS
jgi:hypothetical protein